MEENKDLVEEGSAEKEEASELGAAEQPLPEQEKFDASCRVEQEAEGEAVAASPIESKKKERKERSGKGTFIAVFGGVLAICTALLVAALFLGEQG